MPQLTIIVGMAGSGKTKLCEEIAKQSSTTFSFSDATLVHNDYRRAGYQCLGEIVARLLGRNENCVMDESHLTNSCFRKKFKKFCDDFLHGIEQRWIFFEPNVLKCINNVYKDFQKKKADELPRLKALNNQRKIYKPPCQSEFPGQTEREVYSNNDPQFSDESEAVKWLESTIEHLSSSK